MKLENRDGDLYIKKEVLVFLDTDIIPVDIDKTKYHIVIIKTNKKEGVINGHREC